MTFDYSSTKSNFTRQYYSESATTVCLSRLSTQQLELLFSEFNFLNTV